MRISSAVLALLSPLWLPGCATVPGDQQAANDPLEGLNRAIYRFNREADRLVLKPVAEGYAKITPAPVRQSVGHFFSNLGELLVFGNDLLQLKLPEAGTDAGRFLLNTTVGFFGFFDPATEYGLAKRNEDLGQTLGYWGVGPGPYLMLPLLGPSTLRDGVGLVGDSVVTNLPYAVIDHDDTRQATYIGANLLKIINSRAESLDADQMLDSASTDSYLFLRNAYLQKRAAQVNDGAAPAGNGGISNDDLFDKP